MRFLLTGGSGFIGTHFVELVRRRDPLAAICNVDVTPPKMAEHQGFWLEADILEASQLCQIFANFRPSHVVHMAARTDPYGTTLDDYKLNTAGSGNVIEAIRQTQSVERSIFVSTQYVVRPGALPQTMREYRPYNVYGESKAVMENMIHDADLFPCWTIVRPTNIWGSWHPRYAQEFWLVLKKGRYFHPGGKGVRRAYGYVGNIVDQMWRILNKDMNSVNRRTFYLGDPVEDIIKWVTAFSMELTGKKPRVVPRPLLRAIALAGDVVVKTGRPFPLFTARYRSMTQEYMVDMEPTFAELGQPRYSVQEGARLTVDWLRGQGEIWRR